MCKKITIDRYLDAVKDLAMNQTTTAPIPLTEVDNGPFVQVTEAAIQYIQGYKSRKAEAASQSLRISVEGGGCSGYQYGFSFDTKRDDDLVVPAGSENVLIDPQSKLFLKGCTVDYADSLGGSGFTVTNPNAKASCGCGTSFTV